jgi:hypothetical protein
MVWQLVRQPDRAVLVCCGLWGCSGCPERVLLCALRCTPFSVCMHLMHSRLGNRGRCACPHACTARALMCCSLIIIYYICWHWLTSCTPCSAACVAVTVQVRAAWATVLLGWLWFACSCVAWVCSDLLSVLSFCGWMRLRNESLHGSKVALLQEVM